MCKWNDLFQENSKVIRVILGQEITKGLVNAPTKPGVYIVRSVSHNKPKPMQRMFKCDEDGILHIGRTTNLKDRISSFIRGARNGKEHSEAMRYHGLKCEYEQRGYSSVQIGYLEFSLREAKEIELEWFDEYARIFGELPPLNSKRG
jgi:hypothetical protein